MTLTFSDAQLAAFHGKVLARGQELYRDLAWRNTRDPYAIWISEVMLQQTQVSRVDGRWQRWLKRFPSVEALAQASPAAVLEEWQGMGYNRRALALLHAAQAVCEQGGKFPQDAAALKALPGIGPATAAGIRAFAFNLPSVYLETNVRTVMLHELFPHEVDVSDKALVPLLERTCPKDATDPTDTPRTWYYACLDYGAWLKKTVANPSRRSRTHTRQSKFEGSRRQKRATIVRLLLAAGTKGLKEEAIYEALNEQELAASRPLVEPVLVRELLDALCKEGFCKRDAHCACYRVE